MKQSGRMIPAGLVFAMIFRTNKKPGFFILTGLDVFNPFLAGLSIQFLQLAN